MDGGVRMTGLPIFFFLFCFVCVFVWRKAEGGKEVGK
jgi:hypothetical protein